MNLCERCLQLLLAKYVDYNVRKGPKDDKNHTQFHIDIVFFFKLSLSLLAQVSEDYHVEIVPYYNVKGQQMDNHCWIVL